MCYRSNLISDKLWLNLVSWFSITLVSYSQGTKDIEKKIGLKKYYFNVKPHLTSNTYYTISDTAIIPFVSCLHLSVLGYILVFFQKHRWRLSVMKKLTSWLHTGTKYIKKKSNGTETSAVSYNQQVKCPC